MPELLQLLEEVRGALVCPVLALLQLLVPETKEGNRLELVKALLVNHCDGDNTVRREVASTLSWLLFHTGTSACTVKYRNDSTACLQIQTTILIAHTFQWSGIASVQQYRAEGVDLPSASVQRLVECHLGQPFVEQQDTELTAVLDLLRTAQSHEQFTIAAAHLEQCAHRCAASVNASQWYLQPPCDRMLSSAPTSAADEQVLIALLRVCQALLQQHLLPLELLKHAKPVLEWVLEPQNAHSFLLRCKVLQMFGQALEWCPNVFSLLGIESELISSVAVLAAHPMSSSQVLRSFQTLLLVSVSVAVVWCRSGRLLCK